MTYQLELDDCHRTSHAHPGISVIPAALAICEEKKLDARAFLAAVVVGYEVVTRVDMAALVAVDGRTIGDGMPGPMLRKLNELLEKKMREESIPLL